MTSIDPPVHPPVHPLTHWGGFVQVFFTCEDYKNIEKPPKSFEVLQEIDEVKDTLDIPPLLGKLTPEEINHLNSPFLDALIEYFQDDRTILRDDRFEVMLFLGKLQTHPRWVPHDVVYAFSKGHSVVGEHIWQNLSPDFYNELLMKRGLEGVYPQKSGLTIYKAHPGNSGGYATEYTILMWKSDIKPKFGDLLVIENMEVMMFFNGLDLQPINKIDRRNPHCLRIEYISPINLRILVPNPQTGDLILPDYWARGKMNKKRLDPMPCVWFNYLPFLSEIKKNVQVRGIEDEDVDEDDGGPFHSACCYTFFTFPLSEKDSKTLSKDHLRIGIYTHDDEMFDLKAYDFDRTAKRLFRTSLESQTDRPFTVYHKNVEPPFSDNEYLQKFIKEEILDKVDYLLYL